MNKNNPCHTDLGNSIVVAFRCHHINMKHDPDPIHHKPGLS